MKKSTKFFVCAALVFAANGSWAADRIVGPGQQYTTIQAGINAAQSGDRVLVKPGTYATAIQHNKSNVRVVAEGAVTVTGTSSQNAVRIQCSDCSVEGFNFTGFGWGIDPGQITGRNRVTIKNNRVYGTNYPIWISGDDWLVEGNKFERVIHRGSGDSDYGRIFGNRHVVRRNVFWGTQIPGDLRPGPDYSHTDGLQWYDLNGEVLRDILIEQNIFSDFVQGLFLASETGGTRGSNWTIRHNIFWGTSYIASGNLLGWPSHAIYVGKNGPVPGVRIENNLIRYCGNSVTLARMQTALVERNVIVYGGTVYALDSTPQSALNRGTAGNIVWSNNWNGGPSQGPDKYFDPLLQDRDSLFGADGIAFSLDDGWRLLAPAAAGYGPQIEPDGTTLLTDTTPPTITLIGANPLTLAFGATFVDPGANVTDNVDAPRVIQGTGNVNTGSAGSYTRTYSAVDAAGNAAMATRIVIVQAAPIPPTDDVATQAELDAAVAALQAQINAINSTAAATAQRVTVTEQKNAEQDADIAALESRKQWTQAEIEAISRQLINASRVVAP